jgi:hypothetical protein
MSDNLKVWDALKTPPPEALKPIEGGRQSGMTNISPQWRYMAMTEQFGPVGIGWKYTIDELWNVEGTDGRVFAWVTVYTRPKPKDTENWCDGTPGIGGSMLIAKESAGLFNSDEAFKMAVTDALSVALKMLGVGADIYMGMADGKLPDEKPTGKKKPSGKTAEQNKEDGMRRKIVDICKMVSDGDKDQAGGILYDLTHWTEGDVVKREGTRKPAELVKIKGKALAKVYALAKDAQAAWEASSGKVESADDDGSTWNEETQEYEWGE